MANLPTREAEILQDYNNFYSGCYVSYGRPFRRIITDSAGSFPVEYPLRFSFGIETEQFPNFTGTTKSDTACATHCSANGFLGPLGHEDLPGYSFPA